MLSRDGWPLPDWICATSAAMIFICLGTSIMTLALIAYNRWYLLTQPIIKFKSLYKPRKIVVMIIAAWMYPSILVLVPYFAGLGILGYSKEYKSCTQDTSLPTSDMYSLIAGVCVIFPIFITIIVIYIRIYFFVSRQAMAMSKIQQHEEISLETSSSKFSSAKTTNTSDTSEHAGSPEASRTSVDMGEGTAASFRRDPTDVPCENQSKTTCQPNRSCGSLPRTLTQTPRRCDGGKSQRRVNRYQVTVTKRLTAVVFAFFICMLPFGINVVIPGTVDDAGIPWTGLVLSFNSCINPLIYARTMPEFRRVMWAVIRCRLQEIPEPIACIRRRRY